LHSSVTVFLRVEIENRINWDFSFTFDNERLDSV
jgi:hypothetical protein